MSENGEIYTNGKNFTLLPAVTALTNLTSVSPGENSENPLHQMSNTLTGVLRVAIAPKMILRITDDLTIYLKLFGEHQLAYVLLPQGGHAALPGAERGSEAREVRLLSSEEASTQRRK